ncbi:heparan-alpha-glucosaminide N-acetyltransferase domain-containing protein [Robiginitalea sp. M366]|uniref:acyltransferase family protein n=1 Tax=Robiginitalea aestuariiviva TaxID=3036903 RepID=UPI00240D369C|nr:acyltransferase family protein [Robiginitalea aestuariiviva]MDG1572821.1 heparan-alpha-glucosaminide N-acetyltransferase domain-containing protein [Robiginitalea aestuariiviva]
MENSQRLYFIDAMRAWAILMMLQGHFVDGLLDNAFRDPANAVYQTWKYFRGITAPVFFTVSGFIFTFLLVRAPRQGIQNPRLRKGLRRGVQLIIIGYLLRTNFLGLMKGSLYPSFFLVDVLHCIGAALLLIIGVYVLSGKWRGWAFPALLLGTALVLFLFEPVYKTWDYSGIPPMLANYFTKANGSVFTIIPWVGYAAIGGFLAMAFRRFRNTPRLYLKSIVLSLLAGVFLLWYSSPFFDWAGKATGWELFPMIVSNNYLFIRLGDVMLVFAAFMLLRKLMEQALFLRIGQNTLSIYVIHFIILYGSFTGMGLYRYFHHSLTPWAAIAGALGFMILCTWLALVYDTREANLRTGLRQGLDTAGGWARQGTRNLRKALQVLWNRLLRLLGWAPR